MDMSTVSFNSLLLLERVQLSWLPGWVPESALGVALDANPAVEWYLRHKCPELNGWLDQVMSAVQIKDNCTSDEVRQAEIMILETIEDLLVYVVDPAAYDAQPFLAWDAAELTRLVDFTGKTVMDVGSGTGRLALIAAERAHAVFAVEPVGNLRRYLAEKARGRGFTNVYPADGLITDLPFPDRFADVTMGGHVFGDEPEAEYSELTRVTKPGQMLILCPGNADRDDDRHRFLVDNGFRWSRYEEPGEGMVRKYWRRVALTDSPS
jgi:SAM-dependent methyltransferase